MVDLAHYAPLHRRIETLGLVLYAALAAICVWRMAGATHPAVIASAAIAGWLATDFFSGLAHWAGDTWGSARTRHIGGWFIRPFREHHDDPRAMVRHGFIETNGSSALAGLLLLAIAALLPLESPLASFAQAFLLFLALGGLVANQCHKWAHQKDTERSALARVMQRCGLALSPEAHRRHHAKPHDSFYCTASGWMNCVLEKAGFFRRLEQIVATSTHAIPRKEA